MTKKVSKKKSDAEKATDTKKRGPPAKKRARKQAPAASPASTPYREAETSSEGGRRFPDWQQPHTSLSAGFVPYQSVAIRQALADLHNTCLYAEMLVASTRVPIPDDGEE